MNTGRQERSLVVKVRTMLRDHLRVPLFANAYALMTNQMVAAGLGFLYWMLAARLYSDDVVGVNSATISTIIYMAALAELSFKSAMTRFVPRAGRSTPRLIGTVFGINLSLSLLVSLFLVTIGRHIPLTSSLLESVEIAPLWLVLATMVWSLSYIQDGVLIGMRRARWVLVKNSILNASKLILLVVFYRLLPEYGMVVSWFVTVPVMVLVSAFLIFVRFMPEHFKIDISQTRPITRQELVRSISGDYIGALLAETSTRMLPLMVLSALGKSFTAYYSQAWNIASALYLLATSMTSSFVVEASANMVQLALNSRRILRQMISLLFPVVLVAIPASPLILLVFPSSYGQESVGLLRWLILTTLPYMLNSWYLSYALVLARVRIIILAQGLQLVVTLLASYYLMPVFGITGIGIAWFLSQALISVFAAITLFRVLLHKEDPAKVLVPGQALHWDGQAGCQVEKVTSLEAYQDLLGKAGAASALSSANVFLTPFWLSTYWQVYGQGKELQFLAVRKDGRVVGGLPLVSRRTPGGFRELSIMGTGELTPNDLDVLAAPEMRSAVVGTLADYLVERSSEWDILVLDKLLEDSPTISELCQRFNAHGLETDLHHSARCQSVPLPGSIQGYLTSLSKSKRHNIERRQRNFRASCPDATLVQADTPERVELALQALADLHQARWKKRGYPGSFSSSRFLDFHRRVSQAALQAGVLDMVYLQACDQIVAVEYMFRVGDVVQDYLGSFNEKWVKFSPGNNLVALAIQASIQAGAHRFDFLEGDESYKREWLTESRENVCLRVYGSGWRIRLERMRYKVSTAVMAWAVRTIPVWIRVPVRRLLLRVKAFQQARQVEEMRESQG